MGGKLALLAVFALPCAAAPETAPSAATARELARLEASASESPAARRLFASTRHVPRREARGTGYFDAIAARPGAEPAILLDSSRLRETTELDGEIMLVLALARAELAFPLPVVEAEQAAWQKALLFCVERGASDPKGFGARLAREVRAQGARAASLEKSVLPARTPWAPSEVPALKLPDSALARAGLLLHLAESDPQRFYWTVEAGSPWPPGSARLSELEDLFALRSAELAALKSPPSGPYATLGGRRYPADLVAAAWRLRGTGEVERLRESLEVYDTAGLTTLKLAINRWRREVGMK